MPRNRPLKLFCSYAHEDEDGLDKLRASLSALRRNKLIEDWYDRQIPPGASWDKEIRKQLDSADIILLLISASFIDSDYCMNLEVKRAYELADEGSAVVIPVFYRNCHTEGLRFADGQGTPRDMKWICDQSNQDASWTEVTKFIDRAVVNRRALVDLTNVPGTVQTFLPNYEPVSTPPPTSQTAKRSLTKPAVAGFCILSAVGVLASWFWFAPFDAKSGSARSLLLEGRYSEARKECELAPPSAFRMECLEITSIAIDKLTPTVRRARLEEIDSVYSELLLAEMDINKKNYELSQARYAAIAKQNPDIPQLQFGLGRVLHMLNKPVEALKHYNLALRTNKDIRERLENSGISLSIAGALADAGRFEESEKAYRRLLEKDPSVIFAHIQLVRVLASQGKELEARNQVVKAQSLFQRIGTGELQNMLHNSQTWWYMGDQNKPVLLGGWEQKNPYMTKVFGSVF